MNEKRSDMLQNPTEGMNICKYSFLKVGILNARRNEKRCDALRNPTEGMNICKYSFLKVGFLSTSPKIE
jgi:hypothetical protein